MESVRSIDREALEDALALGQFSCSRCQIKFHGMCGKIGQANPKTAIVTCPSCKTRIKHALPFRVEIIKQVSSQQIGDRIEDDSEGNEK
ncbi:MAG: hypothetical protein VX768_04740 [Planctomycetota bacterium]|nr:hypothetical protein [Planctomycetota bacterium]